MVPPIATNFLSSPDAQVEEQRIIQAEPEDTKTSGTATNIQDEISKSKIKGILRESTTRTGQHHIRVSPFADWNAVSLRNSTVRPTSSSEHFHRASPFAASEEKSNDPHIQPKSKQVKRTANRVRKVENRRERLQAASELFANQEAEAHIANQGVIDIADVTEEIVPTTHDKWYGDLRDTGPTLDKWYDQL